MNFAKQQLLADNWQQIIEVSQRYQAEQVFTPYQEQVENFVMRVPLVGLFSAGKSTLINKLINDNLLSVQITPETAMAVEFYYTDKDEKFIGHYANKEIVLTRDDIANQNFQQLLDNSDIGSNTWVSAYINAPVLQQFPHISLVDLPGLESNLISHSQMIDNYIQKSLAYALVVSAEDGELRSSTQQFLQELSLSQTPIILIVTKSDSKTEADAQDVLTKVESSITALLGRNPLQSVLVSARKNRNLDKVLQAFSLIEAKAESRFNQVVVYPIIEKATFLTQNLDKLINADDATIEQLQAEKQSLNDEMTAFKKKLAKDTERLDMQTQGVVKNVTHTVESRLKAQLDTLASSVLSHQDISPMIENTVRIAVTEGLQTELAPVIQSYIKTINAEMPNSLKVDTPTVHLNDVADNGWNFSDVVTTLAPVLALLKIHPIVAVVSTIVLPVVAKLADMFMSSSKREAQLEAQRESARQSVLNQVIPQVIINVNQALTTIVRDNINQAKSTMETLMNERASLVQQQLDQKEQDIQASQAEQEKRKQVYKSDQAFFTQLIAQLAD